MPDYFSKYSGPLVFLLGTIFVGLGFDFGSGVFTFFGFGLMFVGLVHVLPKK